jgi:hypothetical protein
MTAKNDRTEMLVAMVIREQNLKRAVIPKGAGPRDSAVSQ